MLLISFTEVPCGQNQRDFWSDPTEYVSVYQTFALIEQSSYAFLKSTVEPTLHRFPFTSEPESSQPEKMSLAEHQ